MLYWMAIKKYLLMILKTFLFLAAILLIYFFAMVLFFKSGGESQFWSKALMQYLGVLGYSIPLILVIASTMFFAFQISFDKAYAMRVIPILAAINALLIIPFFLVKMEIKDFPEFPALSTITDVEESSIHPEGDLKVYLHKMKGGTIRNGLIFDDTVYFLTDGSVSKTRLSVSGSRYIGNNGPGYKSYNKSLVRKNSVKQLTDTGISHWLFNHYVEYIKKLKDIFNTSFKINNMILSLLGLFLVSIGFFSLVASISFFFNEKKAYFLSMSTLLIVGLIAFIAFPYYLTLFEVIKFGIKSPVAKVLVPGLFTTVLASLISLGMILLKDALMSKKGGVA